VTQLSAQFSASFRAFLMLITRVLRVIEAYRKYRQGICKLYDTVYIMMWLRFSELLYIVPSGNMA